MSGWCYLLPSSLWTQLPEYGSIKPRLHLQYAAPPNKQMLPLQSALFLITSPCPSPRLRPRPWQCSFRSGSGGGAGLDAAVALEERLGFVYFHRCSKECKWYWNLPEAYAAFLTTQQISGIWPCLLINTHLSCHVGLVPSVMFASGVTKGPVFGVRFCLGVDFS